MTLVRSNGALPGQDERATETLPLPKRSDDQQSSTPDSRAWRRLQRRIAWRHRELARIRGEIAALKVERDALAHALGYPARDERTS